MRPELPSGSIVAPAPRPAMLGRRQAWHRDRGLWIRDIVPRLGSELVRVSAETHVAGRTISRLATIVNRLASPGRSRLMAMTNLFLPFVSPFGSFGFGVVPV